MSSTPSGLLSQIKGVYDKQQDPASAGQLLTQAKVQLAQSGLLLPGSKQDKKDLETARDILSYGALLAVRNQDVSQFDRFAAQLKPFWNPQLGYVMFIINFRSRF